MHRYDGTPFQTLCSWSPAMSALMNSYIYSQPSLLLRLGARVLGTKSLGKTDKPWGYHRTSFYFFNPLSALNGPMYQNACIWFELRMRISLKILVCQKGNRSEIVLNSIPDFTTFSEKWLKIQIIAKFVVSRKIVSTTTMEHLSV